VAAILKTDPVKKLTLSGHTDSKGTDDYNKSLSMRRAEAVREFLLDAGVEADQVVTLAKGDSEPRRPNVTESGEDNPEGRRANRRTEIYLDF
jgi:OOP family OmpA-OmpF porin